MAKESVVEKIVKTHKLDAEGILNLDEAVLETDTEGKVPLSKLFKNFDNQNIKISLCIKVESEPDEEKE